MKQTTQSIQVPTSVQCLLCVEQSQHLLPDLLRERWLHMHRSGLGMAASWKRGIGSASALSPLAAINARDLSAFVYGTRATASLSNLGMPELSAASAVSDDEDAEELFVLRGSRKGALTAVHQGAASGSAIPHDGEVATQSRHCLRLSFLKNASA
jgi:hypothetical protein